MVDKFQYRLTKKQKVIIADNLVGILVNGEPILKDTKIFLSNWILTGPDEKRKAFYDVWELVLKNYYPNTRPVLFRSCSRKNLNGKIASFTGRLECTRRFGKGKGLLLVCDTGEILNYASKHYKKGSYRHTFYPIGELLRIARSDGGWGWREEFLNDYIGEDEYIMKLEDANTYSFKWI